MIASLDIHQPIDLQTFLLTRALLYHVRMYPLSILCTYRVLFISQACLAGDSRLLLLMILVLNRFSLGRVGCFPGEIVESRFDLEQTLIVPRLFPDLHSIVAESGRDQRVRMHHHHYCYNC